MFIPTGPYMVMPEAPILLAEIPEATIEEKLEAARLRLHDWIEWRFELEKMRSYFHIGYAEYTIPL